jgi:NADH dehydrogenase
LNLGCKDVFLILVTGGAGKMGRRLAAALAWRGHKVRILCLPGDSAPSENAIEIAYGDITRKESLPPALAGVETVFHLAAIVLSPGRPEAFRTVNADGTRNMVDAAEAAGVSHFIYVSSISVAYPASNAYSRSKLQGEEWVKGSRMRYTIVRPTLAYEDGGAAEFMGLVHHLKRGPVAFLPAGGRARKNPVHIDDLVSGFLALPGNAEAFGKTYVFCGGETISLRRMSRLLLDHMGRPKPIVGVPAWICLMGAGALWALSKATGRPGGFTYQTYTGLVQDAAPASDSAREDLGYKPRGFTEGIASLASLKDCLRKEP